MSGTRSVAPVRSRSRAARSTTRCDNADSRPLQAQRDFLVQRLPLREILFERLRAWRGAHHHLADRACSSRARARRRLPSRSTGSPALRSSSRYSRRSSASRRPRGPPSPRLVTRLARMPRSPCLLLALSTGLRRLPRLALLARRFDLSLKVPRRRGARAPGQLVGQLCPSRPVRRTACRPYRRAIELARQARCCSPSVAFASPCRTPRRARAFVPTRPRSTARAASASRSRAACACLSLRQPRTRLFSASARSARRCCSPASRRRASSSPRPGLARSPRPAAVDDRRAVRSSCASPAAAAARRTGLAKSPLDRLQPIERPRSAGAQRRVPRAADRWPPRACPLKPRARPGRSLRAALSGCLPLSCLPGSPRCGLPDSPCLPDWPSLAPAAPAAASAEPALRPPAAARTARV